MTVEHVHVHSGGQAVVGMVGTSGAGDHAKIEGQAHATQAQIGYAQQPEMRCPQPQDRAAVPAAGDGEWSMPDACCKRNVTAAPSRQQCARQRVTRHRYRWRNHPDRAFWHRFLRPLPSILYHRPARRGHCWAPQDPRARSRHARSGTPRAGLTAYPKRRSKESKSL
jgi:hypothetical protein